MKFFDNIKDTVKEDLQQTIKQDSKLSIAASCFSIYAFEVLKKELEMVSKLRFLFTSPTFTAEKTQKDRLNSVTGLSCNSTGLSRLGIKEKNASSRAR